MAVNLPKIVDTPYLSLYCNSTKQNDNVTMTFPVNSSLHCFRTAALSMVTLNIESQNPMGRVYAKNHSKTQKLLGVKGLTLSIPESIMETCSVDLTFESVDEILWCYHLNKTSLAVLLHGTICFSVCYKMKFLMFAAPESLSIKKVKAMANSPLEPSSLSKIMWQEYRVMSNNNDS